MNYLIIGAGITGLESALEVRRRDRAGRISILDSSWEAEGKGCIFRPALKEFLAGKLQENQLSAFPPEIIKNGNFKFIQGRLLSIHPETWEIAFTKGTDGHGKEARMGYDRLLLATGARPRFPPFIKEAELFSNVFAFRGLHDTRKIREYVKKGDGEILVMGGGILGVETAEVLATMGLKVTLLARSKNLVFKGIPEQLREKVAVLFEKKGITLQRAKKVLDVITEDDRLTGLVLDSGETLTFQAAIVCTGVVLDSTLPGSAGLEHSRGIHVDQGMRTNREHIFAAGDVAFMPWSNRPTLWLWEPCRRMGRVAGANMAGGEERFQPVPSYFHTQLFDVPLGFFGSFDAPEEGYRRVVREDEDGYRELVLKDDTLVGASFLGGRPEPPPFLHLLETGRALPGDMARLLDDDFDMENLWYL